MSKAVNIEYSISVTKGGVTSEVKMEASIPEGDLAWFKEKYGAKVKAAFSAKKSSSKKEDEPKKESKK